METMTLQGITLSTSFQVTKYDSDKNIIWGPYTRTLTVDFDGVDAETALAPAMKSLVIKEQGILRDLDEAAMKAVPKEIKKAFSEVGKKAPMTVEQAANKLVTLASNAQTDEEKAAVQALIEKLQASIGK